MFRQLDSLIQLEKAACQRSQLQRMSYHWLHEDILAVAGHPPATSPRATLMSDLKKVGSYSKKPAVIFQQLIAGC